MTKLNDKYIYSPAFTIVELLVVIVVIGVLAAITVVSYTGITQRAVTSSLQSDLASASTQLKMFQVENSAYPNSITDCPTPSAGNTCLKSTPGNTYSSYSANNTTSPQTFSLLASNGGQIFKINNNSNPIALEPAPLSPVADWLATTEGDHYGNFYDLVTKQYATVTRSTPKTIYDPTTQHIYDVPANKLAVNPRSDGKSGSEAVIEEARTNYLTNSYGAANNGTAWTDWSRNNFVTGAPTYSLVPGSYKNSAQRIQYTGVAGDAPGTIYFWRTKTTDFAVGETWTGSFYVKGSSAGVIIRVETYASTSSWGTLQYAYNDILLTNQWQKVAVTNTNIPSGTGILDCRIGISSIHPGDTLDVSIDAGQFEKGTFASGYIPTTTTAMTRNADNVTVPTTSWNTATGTIAAVSAKTSGWTGHNYTGYDSVSGNWIYDRFGNDGSQFGSTRISGLDYYGGTSSGVSVGYHTSALTFATGSNLRGYFDSAYISQSASVHPSNLLLNSMSFYIGSWPGAFWKNGPIQRIAVYTPALTSTDIATVTNAIKDGP